MFFLNTPPFKVFELDPDSNCIILVLTVTRLWLELEKKYIIRTRQGVTRCLKSRLAHG